MKKLFEQNGWNEKSQKGSHVKMEKDGKIAIIPMHKELKKGLEKSLKKQLED